ncbi:MAG: metalloregulator ArsR/SmtB family transcription factor [Candidatus Latescibacteria bacterium]|nr:metalloregulator ArsR/SmtB family transcription factor [Candidatus Latescibacterota bacterium]
MVKYRNPEARLDAVFSALTDPTRREMVRMLAAQPEISAGELARPFAMSLPAVSKHLKVLERAGLLRRRKTGRTHRCRLDPGPLASAAEWIEHYRRFWEGQLDSLTEFIEETKPRTRKRPTRSTKKKGRSS